MLACDRPALWFPDFGAVFLLSPSISSIDVFFVCCSFLCSIWCCRNCWFRLLISCCISCLFFILSSIESSSLEDNSCNFFCAFAIWFWIFLLTESIWVILPELPAWIPLFAPLIPFTVIVLSSLIINLHYTTSYLLFRHLHIWKKVRCCEPTFFCCEAAYFHLYSHKKSTKYLRFKIQDT